MPRMTKTQLMAARFNLLLLDILLAKPKQKKLKPLKPKVTTQSASVSPLEFARYLEEIGECKIGRATMNVPVDTRKKRGISFSI